MHAMPRSIDYKGLRFNHVFKQYPTLVCLLSFYLFHSVFLFSFFLSVCRYFFFSFCLSFCLSFFLFLLISLIVLSFFLSFFLSVFLSFCLSFLLLSVFLSFCLSFFLCLLCSLSHHIVFPLR